MPATVDLTSPSVVELWNPHRAPSAEAKQTLVDERVLQVWDLGWRHRDFRAYMDGIRTEQVRSQSVNWRGNLYEPEVFDVVRKRMDKKAWAEPVDLPGGILLSHDALAQDLLQRGLLAAPIVRAGVDNCGLDDFLRSPTGYGADALEVLSLSFRNKIVFAGAALGAEVEARMSGLLAATPAWRVLASMGRRAILTGDCHGIGVARGGHTAGAICPCCGAEWASLGPEQVPPPGLLTGTTGWIPEFRLMWGSPDTASLAVRPGYWHGVGTVITRCAMAHGRWPELRTELDSLSKFAVMNGAVSITGVELIQNRRYLSATHQEWCNTRGLTALANAPDADAALQALKPIHADILRRSPSNWTIGCHCVYDTIASAKALTGGHLDLWREKIVERAHQVIKVETGRARSELVRAMGRARWTTRVDLPPK